MNKLSRIFKKNAPVSKAAWFNDNWAYRQAIPVTSTNGSVQTNVFISFTIDTATLITAGRLQSSCQDIRITDINGNLLKYHVGRTNPCNNAATIIDFLVSSFPDGTSSYYVYYGNPSAPSQDVGAFTQSQASNYSIGTLATAEKAPGPIAYWKFDEGYGTTAQDSTSTNADGTMSGANALNLTTASISLWFNGTVASGSVGLFQNIQSYTIGINGYALGLRTNGLSILLADGSSY